MPCIEIVLESLSKIYEDLPDHLLINNTLVSKAAGVHSPPLAPSNRLPSFETARKSPRPIVHVYKSASGTQFSSKTPIDDVQGSSKSVGRSPASARVSFSQLGSSEDVSSGESPPQSSGRLTPSKLVKRVLPGRSSPISPTTPSPRIVPQQNVKEICNYNKIVVVGKWIDEVHPTNPSSLS